MIGQLFLETAQVAEGAIEHPEVAARWERDSALAGYTVGGLAGHLARAVLTVPRYLEAAGRTQGRTVDASGYFVEVLTDHDPVTSDLHAAVRARSVQEAEGGPGELVHRMREARQQLVAVLDEDRLQRHVQVRDRLELSVADYLETRLTELVVHLDDLAVSVDREPPEVAPEALRCVAAVLGRTAARRVGGWETIRSLSRAERHPAAVRAF